MALLFSGTLFQLFGGIQKEETILTAGSFNIYFGFWTMFIVMIVGGLALPGLEVKEDLAKDFLSSHIRYAFCILVTYSTWIAFQRFRGRLWADAAHYLLLAFGIATVVMTGFYGGELVHRFGLPNQTF